MRTIKFRGKTKEGEWFNGNLLDSGLTATKQYFILPENADNYDEYLEVIPETVGQFTGKFDFNGKEIFEHDYCWQKIDLDEGQADQKLICVWIKEISVFTFLYEGDYIRYMDNGFESIPDFMVPFYLSEKDCKKLVIAGNIIDKPLGNTFESPN